MIDALARVTDPSDERSPAWTIQRLVAWASENFKKHGVETPRLEAELLLCRVLHVDRVRLVIDAKRPLTEEELKAYRTVFQRRRDGEPLAYIFGEREFYGHSFLVSPAVLIPRPDTEILVEVALERTSHRHLSGRALDLCTGSGCVALSFALERRTWRVTGTDVSTQALSIARKNSIRLGAIWGVRLLDGDLYEAVAPEEKYEIILSNPPYIPSKEISTLERSVQGFEPSSALDGGGDGLNFYPRLVEGARSYLVKGGVLAVEVGAGQADEVVRLFTEAGFRNLEKKKDLGGHERVVSGRLLP